MTLPVPSPRPAAVLVHARLASSGSPIAETTDLKWTGAPEQTKYSSRADAHQLGLLVDAVEIVTSRAGIGKRLTELAMNVDEVLSIVPIGKIDPGTPFALPALEPDWDRPPSVRMRVIYREDIHLHAASMRMVRASMAAGTEVRTTNHPPTWMTIVGRSAVMVPRIESDPEQGRILLHGGRYVEAAHWMFEHAWRSASPVVHDDEGCSGLSQWEVRVLVRLATGAKDECAARDLGVSPRTYRRHVTELCETLGASSRFEAGARAAQAGLI